MTAATSIRPEEIARIIRKRIEGFDAALETAHVGTVTQVTTGAPAERRQDSQ